MSGGSRHHWVDADDLLEEWARVSALGRPARPAMNERRPPLLVAATAVVAGLAVIAAVGLAIVLARPLGLGAPPSPTPASQTSAPVMPPVGELRAATWRVDPAAELGPESMSIPVLLTERECASGQSPEGRVAEPVIEYTAEAVGILLQVHMVGGDCQSNPEHAMTVELSEPIGQRTLVDLGAEPPAAPATPTPAVEASYRDRAMARLTELTQLTCFEDTEGGPLIDDSAFDRLVGLAGGSGWAAVDGVWVGERRWAPAAFGTWEVLEESEQWALIVRWAGHYPQAVGLRTYARPGQPPVTVKVYELHVCGDPTWQGSTDPAAGTPPGFQRPVEAPHPDGLRTDLDDCAELDVASTSDDSGMSYEYKTMSFTYFDSAGNEQGAEVRFTDAACQEHPVIGPLIEHLIETVSETDAPSRTQRPGDSGE